MRKLFSIMCALVLLAGLALVAAVPVLADATPGWTDITQVAAGGWHTVGLKSDATVVAVGFNERGQCDVGAWTDITEVATGLYYTVGLKLDGTAVATGSNDDGQCNVAGWTDIIQITAGEDHTVGLKSDHTVVAVGNNDYGECNVGNWTDIGQVSAGGGHTVGLRSDGTVVAVGRSDYGQCDVDGWTDIIQIAAGGLHTVGLKSDGTVVAVGFNYSGQCDITGWTSIVQVAAGAAQTVGLRSDGTVVAVGVNDAGQCDVSGWTSIVQVASGRGGWHTVGLKSDGTVVAVGDNTWGQCGAGVTETITGHGIVDAIAQADTEVEVTGTATVTVLPYASNPHPGASVLDVATPALNPFADETDWIELNIFRHIQVLGAEPGTEVEIRLYYTNDQVAAKAANESSLRLFYYDYDTSKWEQCSVSSVNMTDVSIEGKNYSGYMLATVNNTTMPHLSDMDEDFGGYGHPSSTGGGGFCFIATAAYGTDTASQLDILREFRDNILLPSTLGTKLVSFYYRTSPPVANFVSRHEALRTVVRVGFLDPIVRILTWSHKSWSG
jgi:alpha-tubulin suppressor-like RCC1 family protein